VKPELNLLAVIFNEIESKYRAIKKQIEAIADRFVEDGDTSEDDRITENLKSGEEIKVRYLEILQKHAHYQKELSASQPQNTSDSTEVLGAVVQYYFRLLSLSLARSLSRSSWLLLSLLRGCPRKNG